jgi:hypothetical protein
MQVIEYSVADGIEPSDGDFFVAVMDVISPDEKPSDYTLSYVPPGVFSENASFIISLKGQNGVEGIGWLLAGFPADVAEITCTEGVLVKDWETGAELKLYVTEKGEVDA